MLSCKCLLVAVSRCREHDDVMLQLLLFCEGPPSLKGILKSCYMSCMEDRERNPSTWYATLRTVNTRAT